MESILSQSATWLRPALVLGGGVLVGLVVHLVLFAILGRMARRTATSVDDVLLGQLRNPARVFVLLVLLKMVTPAAMLSELATSLLAHLTSILLIVAVTWLVIALTRVGRDLVTERYDITAADNLDARKVHTQYDVLSKIVIAVVITLGLASILMTFEQVRQLGAGILASAGVLGIIVGFAAQKSLATLLAGIQLAITQPIRLDDVVIVEGEWGRIEDITLTFVVVRIWDQRRLVVPVTLFLEQPFQNWTRVTAELLGTVYLYVDATVPVDALRAELTRIVADDPRWDGRVAQVVMTDVTERTVQVRALVSAADSGKGWDLRCHVREKLVDFIQREYPEVLPRLRAEMVGEA